MKKEPKKSKKDLNYEKTINDLTMDLQRTRADFENYTKRIDGEKTLAREAGQASTILKLLPVIDNIERSISYIPEDLKGNKWTDGIVGLVKNLEKSLDEMGIKRINAKPGVAFNPNLHEAVMFDEAEGDSPKGEEVIAEEMQPGYTLEGRPIRHSMVKVTRR